MITGYVVNPARTKMLLHFHETHDQWQPVGGWADSEECLRQKALERVTETTGLQAKHVTTGSLSAGGGAATFILEADDTAVSPYELEEQYNAQWLDRDQILSCTCMHQSAREFALGHLKAS